MSNNRKQKIVIAKLTAAVLMTYFLCTYLWLNIVELSSELRVPESPDFITTSNDDIARRKNAADSKNEDTPDNEDDADNDDDVINAIVSSESDPIVNPVLFRYRINNERLCQFDESSHVTAGGHVFLFVYIHTAPENYMKRLLLRQTWVRSSLYNLPVRFAFVLGTRSTDGVMDQAVQLESDHFGDIVQGDFHDSYKNLTLKSLYAIHWITQNCNRSRFVLKTDDDAYVNMRALLRHLSDIYNSSSKPRHVILCRIWSNMHVLRDDPKWGVSREDYKEDFYPPYCSGIAWVMTPDMIRALDRISNRVKYFWIDDVYITGILTSRLRKLGLSINLAEFGHAFIRMDKMEEFDSPRWYRYLFVHLAETHYFAKMWSRMEVAAAKYPIPAVKHIAPGFIAGHNYTISL